MKITISNKSLKQLFHSCDAEFIRNICHGRCCEGTGKIMITINPSEEEKIRQMGGEIENGLLKSNTNKCPFKKENGLCGIHENQPIGCVVSPFTFTKKGTLIVRNRYRMLKCYRVKENKIPIYQAHRRSLEFIFGKEESDRICNLVENSDENFEAEINEELFNKIIENDKIKKYGKINR